ncbi:MAG: acylphosphatase [Halomonas sp.]|uniref:acylphosphatase n=1 Tax=Halomonas sp. TaxID=1486246 RepID=UPI002ACDDED5|nr:acylphosphatase [Halomonas sp.]MDZ7854342.1 acylphosphatase [Halomonas sp.]
MAGVVQGVGFRPFVQRLASRLALAGQVRNHGGEVVIEAQGAPTGWRRSSAPCSLMPRGWRVRASPVARRSRRG